MIPESKGQARFEFISAVSSGMRGAVEALFFFNPRQQRVRQGILVSVELYGRPEILELNGKLWIGVSSGAMQCLFACDQSQEPARPAGVMLYLRPAPEILSITHLAVDPDYTAGGSRGGEGLGLLMIGQLRNIARRINGVSRIELPYRKRCFLPVTNDGQLSGQRRFQESSVSSADLSPPAAAALSRL